MGGAESAQSPGSHTLNWSHGDLACAASPTYFMGLRSPERAVSSASCMRHVGGAPASTLRVTVTPVLRCACSISALAFITLVTSVAFLNRLEIPYFHTPNERLQQCISPNCPSTPNLLRRTRQGAAAATHPQIRNPEPQSFHLTLTQP